MFKNILLIFSLFFSLSLLAQNEEPPDFNSVKPVGISDFSPTSTLVTPETEAVILVDSGSSKLDANLDDGFFMKYYKFSRTLVLKKSVLNDVGKVSLLFSKEMNGRKLKNLRAYTYNLDNGKIFRDELQDVDFYYEETKNDLRIVKFTFPNVKVGSIIEFEYSERWGIEDLENWNFQSGYPKLKSIYTVTVPDLFNFSIQFQNKTNLTNTAKSTIQKTVYSSRYEYLNSTITTISWTFENVPAMNTEPFTSTLGNFLACVKFQLSARPVHPGAIENVARDWQEVCNNILSYDQFGSPPSFLKKQASQLVEGKTTDLEKARAIYSGVRDHFKVDDRIIFLRGTQTLNDVYKTGTGSVGAINSVLIAMLKSQKMQADPVILATRDKGLTNQSYPLLDHYNYLICRLMLSGKEYFLDASNPTMGFGKIPLDCFNGHARVVTLKNFPVFLAPDSLKECKLIKAKIRSSDDSPYWTLECTNQAGYYESSDIRLTLKGKTEESLFKENTQTVPLRKSLDSFSCTHQKDLDEPLDLYYKMTLDPGKESHLYFNPFLNLGLTENPFKSAQRLYPVEMPYVLDKTYELDMDVPPGYVIEELPKSEKFLLNDSEASYEYIISSSGNKIHLKSSLVFSKSIFEPEDYSQIRNFYAGMIKKQNELVVFRKK